MPSPNFEKFLDQFNKHALSPILAAGKEKLDQTLAALPTDEITRSLEDAYAQLANNDAASGLGSLDTTRIAESVEALKEQLQKPVVSSALAQGIKSYLDKNSTESLITNLLANASPTQQLTLQMMLSQLGPKLDELRVASVDEVAQQIRTAASNLSGDEIAAQISMLLQAAPEMFPQQAPDLSKLPAPQAVADAVQEVGKIASNTLDNASKGASFAETVSALKQFAANANEAFTRALGQDYTPPAAPKQTQEKPAPKAPDAPKKRKGGKGYKF